jgi:hypothetical protein
MKLLWRRILVGLAIIIGVAYLYTFIFGAPFFLTKRDFNNPAMWLVPAAVPDLAISTASGMKLSYFGWDFDVPWKDLDPSKTSPIGKPPWQWQVIGFRSGRQIVFIRHSANNWSKALSPPMNHVTEKAYERTLLGADTWSDCAFTRAMLEATPDQLTPFTFRREGVRLTLLLLFKSIEIMVHDSKSGIFMIDTSDFRGFQYGNPESRQSRVDDVLYSDRGGVEFWFRSCPPNKAPISQADINRVIRTVKLLDRAPEHTAR